jgi:hypothetical protein
MRTLCTPILKKEYTKMLIEAIPGRKISLTDAKTGHGK